MAPTEPLLVLVAPRSEAVRRVAGAGVFVVLGAVLIAQPGALVTQRVVSAVAAAIFPYAGLRQGRALLRRASRLELAQDGFRLVDGLGEREVRWEDCSPFFVGRRRPWVVFDETSGFDRSGSRIGRFGSIVARAYGCTSLLPSTNGRSPADLADLMDRCRANALTGRDVREAAQARAPEEAYGPGAQPRPSGPATPRRGRHR